MLIAGCFARRVAQANVDQDIPSSVKSKVMVHYVLCVICCTASGLAAGFGINGLVYCLAEHNQQLRAKCTPNHDLKTAFVGVDVALAALLLPLIVTGMALFCLHARTLGFADQLTRMQNEVAALRVQVESLQRSQGVGAGLGDAVRAEGGGVGAHHLSQPPPPYSEFQNGDAYGYSSAQEYGYGKSKSAY